MDILVRPTQFRRKMATFLVCIEFHMGGVTDHPIFDDQPSWFSTDYLALRLSGS